MVVHLFSYGTLQQPEVQLATFGRRLDGRSDTLPGFAVVPFPISDATVVALSGAAEHPTAVPSDDPAARVDGTVFAISHDDLLRADGYEVDGYVRVERTLGSGTTAWVFVDGRAAEPDAVIGGAAAQQHRTSREGPAR